jgi:hypothetical protein
MNDIAMIAREQLEKEYRRLCISLERAEKKYVVPAQETDDLKRKIAVNLYLQQRCE